jgi:hypothetical protein
LSPAERGLVLSQRDKTHLTFLSDGGTFRRPNAVVELVGCSMKEVELVAPTW